MPMATQQVAGLVITSLTLSGIIIGTVLGTVLGVVITAIIIALLMMLRKHHCSDRNGRTKFTLRQTRTSTAQPQTYPDNAMVVRVNGGFENHCVSLY